MGSRETGGRNELRSQLQNGLQALYTQHLTTFEPIAAYLSHPDNQSDFTITHRTRQSSPARIGYMGTIISEFLMGNNIPLTDAEAAAIQRLATIHAKDPRTTAEMSRLRDTTHTLLYATASNDEQSAASLASLLINLAVTVDGVLEEGLPPSEVVKIMETTNVTMDESAIEPGMIVHLFAPFVGYKGPGW